jgi:hypothetical protein
MDNVSKNATPEIRPPRKGYAEIKVQREDYFRRLGSPYEMFGYVSRAQNWGDAICVRPHPNLDSSNRHELFVEIEAIESLEVL